MRGCAPLDTSDAPLSQRGQLPSCLTSPEQLHLPPSTSNIQLTASRNQTSQTWPQLLNKGSHTPLPPPASTNSSRGGEVPVSAFKKKYDEETGQTKEEAVSIFCHLSFCPFPTPAPAFVFIKSCSRLLNVFLPACPLYFRITLSLRCVLYVL